MRYETFTVNACENRTVLQQTKVHLPSNGDEQQTERARQNNWVTD